MNCVLPHLRLYPPSWSFPGSSLQSRPSFPSSIPLHLPTACRTLTAGCVYHQLSDRGITSHCRLAGWPCRALSAIHTTARLIQLAWLAEETSAILITKMMYFNPTKSIQQWKAGAIYSLCVHMCVQKNVTLLSFAIISKVHTFEQKYGWVLIQKM